MTNPNNAIGTNGAYGGRTSVDAFNDDLAMFSSRGVVSGFAVSPDSGLTVSLGGNGTTRDVALAEDNIGNKTTINNISKAPISVTISGAPANNSRIDSIVAYVEKPAQGTSTAVDNPGACGLIVVEGTTASTPSVPDDNAIRTAITNDGASGTTAYYVVLGNITIPSGTTTITSNMIEQGAAAPIRTNLARSVVDAIYPVGSIYMSSNSVNPATFLGGTWNQIQDKFLLAAGSIYNAGDTGGNATHNHTLSDSGYAAIDINKGQVRYRETRVAGWQATWKIDGSNSQSATTNEDYASPLRGNTDNASSMPPYLVVYVWERIA